MTYLERHAPMKYRPDAILPGCRSVIVAALPYAALAPHPVGGLQTAAGGRVARYARHRDYHDDFGDRLHRIARRLRDRYPDDRFRAFTDTAPLDERFYAQRAGIGFLGRNGTLINKSFGSWMVIGEILSTHAFPATAGTDHGACPPGCFACGRACPTGALQAPGKLDARRCISYLTIEHRGVIDFELALLMGDWIFGCDRCQEVCPLNAAARTPNTPPAEAAHLDLGALLRLADDDAFDARFAGTALHRTGRVSLLRNACIAAGNANRTDLAPEISELACGSDSILAPAAGWVYNRLYGHGGSLLRRN